MIIIGIDPGQSGGVAWLDTDVSGTPFAVKMPETPREFANMIREVVNGVDIEHVKAFIEKVNPMPKQGIVSAWTFANTFWGPQWALATLGIRVELVSSMKWQKAMECRTGGDKNVSKAKALQLWPSTKWIHATADAALICEYGRRQP